MQDKIHKKLLDLAEQLGGDDFQVSAHDYYEGYEARSEAIAVGDSLLELIDEDDFVTYIMKTPTLIEAYIQGYVSAIDFEDEIPENINEGDVVCISVVLTNEQQNRIRELAAKKIQEDEDE